jgi:hypothetical protein
MTISSDPILGLWCFGSSAADFHLPFSHSHAGTTALILTNKFTTSVLKGGPDRPHCSWLKRLPALKSGKGVRRNLCGAGQITHAPSQCSACHSALYRQQFATMLRLIASHPSMVRRWSHDGQPIWTGAGYSRGHLGRNFCRNEAQAFATLGNVEFAALKISTVGPIALFIRSTGDTM